MMNRNDDINTIERIQVASSNILKDNAIWLQLRKAQALLLLNIKLTPSQGTAIGEAIMPYIRAQGLMLYYEDEAKLIDLLATLMNIAWNEGSTDENVESIINAAASTVGISIENRTNG